MGPIESYGAANLVCRPARWRLARSDSLLRLCVFTTSSRCQSRERNKIMRILRIMVWSGWSFLIVAVALAFLFPHFVTRIVGPMFFQLLIFFVVIVSALYRILRLYKAGM